MAAAATLQQGCGLELGAIHVSDNLVHHLDIFLGFHELLPGDLGLQRALLAVPPRGVPQRRLALARPVHGRLRAQDPRLGGGRLGRVLVLLRARLLEQRTVLQLILRAPHLLEVELPARPRGQLAQGVFRRVRVVAPQAAAKLRAGARLSAELVEEGTQALGQPRLPADNVRSPLQRHALHDLCQGAVGASVEPGSLEEASS
mmetsp:Transcript_24542/g.70545  ORF Transcript_24542/g.70545 Transcript_24542/m.70545 type:complete len:202 (-) Transcript_24542:254-859(-)